MSPAPRHLARRVAALPALVAATALGAQPPTPPSTGRQGPPPIEDNSFLVEEAYNQPRGVVQHVGTFARFTGGPAWIATFTQEWPVGGQAHQLSFTAAEVHPDVAGVAAHLGDLALHYRYQARDRGGALVAPRATVVLPTGSARVGAGAGGMGYQTNLPVTFELSPHWAAHSNVGGTVVPRGRAKDGTRTRSANVTVAQSAIWVARPEFNVMLEALWSRTVTSADGGGREYAAQTIVSPGVRYAVNLASGMQIVPGLAAPITLHGVAGRGRPDVGVFAYLSVEHAFARTR
jgi:hypothetical protein